MKTRGTPDANAAAAPQVITRAVTLRVLKPADDRRWDELWPDLNRGWEQARAAANETVRTCVRHDRWEWTPEPKNKSGRKLAKWALPAGLYRLVRDQFPDMPAGTLSAVLRDVARKYARERFAYATGQKAVPNYRQMPIAVRQQDWALEWAADGTAAVCCQIGVVHPGRRWRLLLRRGKGWNRAYDVLEQIRDGAAERRNLELIEQPHAHGKWVMAKIVYQKPVGGPRPSGRPLVVRTHPDSLLRARCIGDAGKNTWWYHGDQVQQWIVQQRLSNRRLREDSKLGRVRRGRGPRQKMHQRSERHQRRIKTALQQIAADLAAHAQRRRVPQVIYDDTLRTFLPAGPYAALALQIEHKLAEAGIGFVPRAALEAQQKKDRAALELAGLQETLNRLLEESDDDDDA